MKYERIAQEQGFDLRKFNHTDTRRHGIFETYRYYLAKDNRMLHRFERLVDIGEFLEQRQNLRR